MIESALTAVMKRIIRDTTMTFISKLVEKNGVYADYSDRLDFVMRESALVIDSLITESYPAGVLLLDQDCLLEIVS